MKMTSHARKRCQQRAISQDTLGFILDYGRIYKAPGGATKFFLGNKEYNKIMSDLKQAMKLAERAKNGALILIDERIITAYKAEHA